MKILLVEDDQPTGTALQDLLTRHHYTINLATDGQTGLEMASAFEYDLILLDVIIPKLDGISVCQQLRSQGYQSPILLLTAKDSSNDLILGLDAGADDYVVKPFDEGELLARIRALLRRGKPLASDIIWETLKLDPSINQVTCHNQTIHLTPKEYCLLELFLLNPKRIFSRSAILDRLWDFADSPGEETVSTHIKCLRQKLKAAGSTDPIETVHGLGYRLRVATAKAEDPAPPQKAKKVTSSKVTSNIAKIWERTKGTFTAQIATLEQAADALTQARLTPDMQQQAKQAAHKLAGSLGIFGCMDGSQLARQLEHLLQNPVEQLSAAQVSDLVHQVHTAIAQQPEVEAATESTRHAPLILIVDDDLTLADRVRVEAIAWGLRVEVAPDLTIARTAIAQSPPDVILLDLSFPGSDDSFTLLQELMQRVKPIPVLAFTGRGSLEDRLKVSRLGGCIFLQKPLPTYEILKAVTDVLTQTQVTHHNRVMIVDDDLAVLERMVDMLKPLGLEVIPVSQPQQFWDVLTAQLPNLLILDLDMPELTGLELCRTVRGDRRWQHLPILFLSSHTEAQHLEQAFTVGADDYISKWVTAEELTMRILHRLRRGGFQGDSQEGDLSAIIGGSVRRSPG